MASVSRRAFFKAAGTTAVVAGVFGISAANTNAQEIVASPAPGTAATTGADFIPGNFDDSIFGRAAQYSNGFRGVGIAVLKGKLDDRLTKEQIGHAIEERFEKTPGVEAAYFAEDGENDRTRIHIFIGGIAYRPGAGKHDVYTLGDIGDYIDRLAALQVELRRDRGLLPTEPQPSDLVSSVR